MQHPTRRGQCTHRRDNRHIVDVLLHEESGRVAPIFFSLFDSLIKANRGASKIVLPGTIRVAVEELPISTEEKSMALVLVDEVFNNQLVIESYGGAEAIGLVKKWLEDPTSVDLRSFINTTVANQMSIYESQQYNLALVLDLAALSPESTSQAYGGWGGIEPGESSDRILAAISILPDKDKLAALIKQAKSVGAASHPVLDSAGTVRFPKKA